MTDKGCELTVTADGTQFVTFYLDDEEYGVEILKVQEIIGLSPVTRVPNLPDFIKGVINLRGIVVPVIDLRIRFGLAGAEYTDRTCIIILKVDDKVFGIIVDTVSEVISISQQNIQPTPSFGSKIRTEFIKGMGKIGERLVILLDAERLLSDEEIQQLKNVQDDISTSEEIEYQQKSGSEEDGATVEGLQ